MAAVRALIILVRNVLVALTAALQNLVRVLVAARPVEWVVYELDGPLARGEPEERRLTAATRFGRGPRISSLERLRGELDLLRQVPSVRGIVLQVKHPHCGAAVLLELRALLSSFRASGRAVIVHAEALGLREYWLCSVADRIWMTPRGRLELVGFATAATAAARPLGRLGLVAKVVRAGRFKAAGELVGNESVSDEQLHQTEELLDDLHRLFVSDVAASRGLSAEAMQSVVDQGPYSARRALEAGLVDELLYADEVRERLGRDSPDGRKVRIGPFLSVLATHGPAADWRPPVDRRPLVAVVDVEGLIASGKSRSLPALPAMAGSETIIAALTRLRRDRQVRAVVLRIDSRGGSALASDVIWRAAAKLAEKKPLVAWMENVAASGGYYIAAAARTIVAAPTCITGSIGVISIRLDATGALQLAEIDRKVIRRGRRAGIFRPDVPFTDEDEAALAQDARETYDDFVSVVAGGRSLSVERVRELGEGRVYLATRAKELGLVDRLGSLNEAIDEARRLAGVEGDVRLVRMKSRRASWREMLRMWKGEESATTIVSRLLDGPVQACWPGERPL